MATFYDVVIRCVSAQLSLSIFRVIVKMFFALVLDKSEIATDLANRFTVHEALP